MTRDFATDEAVAVAIPPASAKDALENLLIAISMGWDLAGVIQQGTDALAALPDEEAEIARTVAALDRTQAEFNTLHGLWLEQAAEIERLKQFVSGGGQDLLDSEQGWKRRAEKAERERDDHKRKLDEAVKALEEIAEKRFRFGDISVERMNMWFNCRARAALTEGK